MNYRIINGQTYPVGNFGLIENVQSNKSINKNVNTKDKTNSFKDVLNNAISKEQSFTISKHAELRLNEINFTKEDMKNIEKGFEIAKDKGSKNTVMLYKDVALIASVENKTLITAIEKERAKDNIFTNVDSVVIL
ncbi:TIGR02530 family flagellar biosynthesis protein [Clostridium uliginosum]|uniref:Flagellar operon protein n=1 Tax=Clostridium uliginosum TaxID=119641 RepID=A0A1I1KKU8_9CLOT|nr:TIGR02530 family flagellar biosynthesis protein [Clostridium uliginosum]SFC61291.1 flagellar operon protein [Clostridium uliginosum]